ncbi:MAG: helix-turn-helix transcriptional regulator [Thermaerobacter sp.]|nr:helix-turn-helix transcriptional regulator [Thermaerobacter sp.]
MSWWERLRAAREAAGYTQIKVAEALKVSDRTYSAWETGRNEPGYKYLVQLAEMFETTPNTILLGGSATDDLDTRDLASAADSWDLSQFLVSVVDRQLALMEQDRVNARRRIEEVEGPEARAKEITAEKDKIVEEKERQIQATNDLMMRRLAGIDPQVAPHFAVRPGAEAEAVAK